MSPVAQTLKEGLFKGRQGGMSLDQSARAWQRRAAGAAPVPSPQAKHARLEAQVQRRRAVSVLRHRGRRVRVEEGTQNAVWGADVRREVQRRPLRCVHLRRHAGGELQDRVDQRPGRARENLCVQEDAPGSCVGVVCAGDQTRKSYQEARRVAVLQEL